MSLAAIVCKYQLLRPDDELKRDDSENAFLLGRVGRLAAHLLRLKVLVEQEKGRLVSLGGTHDGEHAFATFVVGSLYKLVIWDMGFYGEEVSYLGDRDAGTGGFANLGNLASSTANDATDHVSRDADVLSLKLLAILVVGGRASGRSVRVGTTAVRTTATATTAAVVGSGAEVGTVSSAHDAGGRIL